MTQLKLAVLASCAFLCGAGSGPFGERLDTSTGATVVTGKAALVFARGRPQFSRSGRDYLYLGPVEVNRQGERSYYLWVGVASTIDRRFVAPSAGMGEPTAMYVEVRGEPMKFALVPWGRLAGGLALEEIYSTPVPLQAQLGARVTFDQLRLLAEEGPVVLGVAGGASASTERYRRWNAESETWSGFVERAAQ
jgi:hypothetical protein